jgi:hypothetical protein
LREEEGRRKQKNRLTLRPMGKHTAGKIRKIPSRPSHACSVHAVDALNASGAVD